MSLHEQQRWFVRDLFCKHIYSCKEHAKYKLIDQEVTVPSSIHYLAWCPNLYTGHIQNLMLWSLQDLSPMLGF